MKKILSILMILVLVGGAAFAQVEPAFKGDATLSWGIDLGKGTTGDDAKISHGFKNEASASVTMDFLKDAKKTRGEGAVYAHIDLSKINLGLSADMKEAKVAGGIGEVSAKIVFFGAYVTLYNAPNMTTSYANRIIYSDDKFETGFGGFGTKIGYENKDKMDLNVGLKFVSNGSWEDRDKPATAFKQFKKMVEGKYDSKTGKYKYSIKKTEDLENPTGAVLGGTWNTERTEYVGDEYMLALFDKPAAESKDNNGKYAFGLDFHMTPVEKYLTVDANFNMTFDAKKFYKKDVKSAQGDERVISFGVKLASEPVEGLTFDLGFDGGTGYTNNAKKSTFAWALGFGAKYAPAKVGTFDLGLYASSDGTKYGTHADAPADMAMTFGYAGLPLVEGLDLHARLNVFNLLKKPAAKKTIPLGFNLGGAYTVKITDSMNVKPYFDFWGETNATAGDTSGGSYLGVAFKAGVEFMPMEKLTIDASWAMGKVDPAKNETVFGKGALTPMQNRNDNGKFILSAKITF